MNKQLEIFVTCFYVWTKIGLRTLSLAFFLGEKLDWIFILKYWTGLGVEKISVRSSLQPFVVLRFHRRRDGEYVFFCLCGTHKPSLLSVISLHNFQ